MQKPKVQDNLFALYTIYIDTHMCEEVPRRVFQRPFKQLPETFFNEASIFQILRFTGGLDPIPDSTGHTSEAHTECHASPSESYVHGCISETPIRLTLDLKEEYPE